MGDFNCDFMGKCNSSLYKSFKELLNTFNCFRLIDSPTRVTDSSSSCIDLIFSSDKTKISQSGVIPIGIRDHFMTYCTRKVSRSIFNKHKTSTIRSLKNYTKEKIIEQLKEINWFQVLNCDDVGKAWSAFHGLFAGVIDKVAPVKKVRLKQRSEPWITHEILELIKERDKVLLEFKRSNQKSSYEQFCKIRNLIQNKMKKPKNLFIMTRLKNVKGHPPSNGKP